MLTDKDRIELDLHYLSYSRYVSRGQTIFSTFFNITLAVIFGAFSITFSLVEIKYIPEFNKFHFLRTCFYSGSVLIFLGFLSFYKWYESRIVRSNIIEKVKDIQNKV